MDAKQIAAGLTKAQRALLLSDGWCADSYQPAKKLVELGVANRRYSAMGSHSLVWTPLGLAVRAELEASDADG